MTRTLPVPVSFCVLPSRLAGRDVPQWITEDEPEARANFDTHTLFYDVFWTNGKVIAIGPPLQRPFRQFLKQAQLCLDGTPVSFTETSDAMRACRIEIEAPTQPSLLQIHHPSASFHIPVGGDLTAKYAGSNALFTLSRNNDLEWVRDWAQYHVRTQGVDAIVVFDNASETYGSDALTSILSSINGLKTFDVVPMPFMYGPSGARREQTNSRFLQYGVFDMVRLRFLSRAAGVLNLDIDEMAFTPEGDTVFDQVKRQDDGFLTLKGQWRYPEKGAQLCHASHIMRANPETTQMYPKWCIDPQGPMAGRMWRTHGLKGVPDQTAEGFGFFHCRMISTHWDYNRSEFAELNLEKDPHAERALHSL